VQIRFAFERFAFERFAFAASAQTPY